MKIIIDFLMGILAIVFLLFVIIVLIGFSLFIIGEIISDLFKR